MADPDAPGGRNLRVAPGELEGSGQGAQKIAGEIPPETKKVVEPSDAAANELKGWAAAGALRDCTDGWKKLLDGLAKDMDAYGGKLIATGQGYRTVEHTVAASMAAPAPAQVSIQPGGPDPFDTLIRGGGAPKGV
ncbi:hypothetical protein ACWGB8_35655 [Kitasatospora sp. NPDC054939]